MTTGEYQVRKDDSEEYQVWKEKISAQCGARTHDPGIKSPMLYRLS